MRVLTYISLRVVSRQDETFMHVSDEHTHRVWLSQDNGFSACDLVENAKKDIKHVSNY